MMYGYARVSTKGQNLDRQIVELTSFGVEKKNLFEDRESGKDFDRKNYTRLRKKLKRGDVLVIKSIDRLGRNYNMILEEWAYLTKTVSCDIVVLDMDLLDTRMETGLMGRFIADLVLQILSFVSENERMTLKQRQAEGIRIAKEKGVKFGRPTVTLCPDFDVVALRYGKGLYSLREALRLTQMSRGSFYKYFRLRTQTR